MAQAHSVKTDVLSYGNRWLIVPGHVNLTDVVDPVIYRLDPFFERANLRGEVSRALVTSSSQLALIRRQVQVQGLLPRYPEIEHAHLDDRVWWHDQFVYAWQPGWSALLNVGYIINPPRPAECLMDYWRNGVNKKGQVIRESPHQRGTAFDIRGSTGEPGIVDELRVVERAIASGEFPDIAGILPEHKNGCVHVDVQRS